VTNRWWIPALLPKLLEHYQVTVESIEHRDRGGFQLSNLRLAQPSVELTITQLDVPDPLHYAWERFNQSFSATSSIYAHTIRIQLRSDEPPTESATPGTPTFLPSILEQAEQGIIAAKPWLPDLHVDQIEILAADRTPLVSISEFKRQGQIIQLRATNPALPSLIELQATLPDEGTWAASLKLPEHDASGEFTIQNGPLNTQLTGVIRHAEASIKLRTDFSAERWLPTAAHVFTERLSIPVEWIPANTSIKVTQLEVRELDANWDGSAYDLTASASVEAKDASGMALDAQSALHIKGDLDQLQLLEARLQSDWATLNLSEPVIIQFAEKSLDGEAQLSMQLDLSRLPKIEATGKAQATLTVRQDRPNPRVAFALNADELSYQNQSVKKLTATGWFDFNSIHIAKLQAKPNGSENPDLLELSGSVDWSRSVADLKLNALLDHEWLNQIIGQPLFTEPLIIEQGTLTGWIDQPRVQASFSTSVESPQLNRTRLSGVLKATSLNRIDGTLKVVCEQSEINLLGSVEQSEDSIEVELTQLQWKDPERPQLDLAAPTQITWLTAPSTAPWEQRLNISTFQLRGTDMDVTLAYHPDRFLDVGLENISLYRLDRWLKADLPHYQIESIQANLTALRPQIVGSLKVNMHEVIDSGTRIDLQLLATLDQQGMAFEQLNLDFQGQPILSGNGQLPTQVALLGSAEESPIRILEDSRVRGTLTGRSTTEFETWLEEQTEITLTNAHLNLNIQGELLDPSGSVAISVEALRTDRLIGKYAVPELRDFKLNSRIDSNQLQLEQLSFSLRESAVESSLSIPLLSLQTLATAPVPDLTAFLGDLKGQIALKDWRMEDWTDYMTPALRRTGLLDGTLSIQPGLNFSGQLDFKDFALRPTQSLPSVNTIQGKIILQDRQLRIESASALLGGSRVELAGKIDLDEQNQPRWEIALTGQNVPVTRTKDMILRSDLDLKVATVDQSEAVLVSGKLNLRSSTLLIDFDPLAPSVDGGTTARPPFFQISEPSFANWRFDLKLIGEEFMRVRSPYFRTVLSANLDLKGSFANPELLGSIRTIGGELNFPGAKFSLDEGEAFIEPSRPDVVQLNFSGIAQRASRVIVVEVSQTLDDPHVLFQSTPQMSNAAIVRFLATGSTTGGGFGNVGLYLGQGMLGAGSLDSGITENLTVDIGEETTKSGRGTLGARYELSPKWSIEGDYDKYDAYNANLIWSIFKR
jgi:hypothetical protein